MFSAHDFRRRDNKISWAADRIQGDDILEGSTGDDRLVGDGAVQVGAHQAVSS